MSRVVVVVAGTGTEIGKTWVTAGSAAALARARGIAVAARKPAQSFAPDDDAPTDADVLARGDRRGPARGVPAAPLAPARDGAADGRGGARAARRSRSPTSRPRSPRAAPADAIVLVESAGGVRSPLAADGDTVTLADALQPALVVLVADAGLGTINLVRLSVDALARPPRRRVPQPLRRRRRPARAQPRLARDASGPRGRDRPRGPRDASWRRSLATSG